MTPKLFAYMVTLSGDQTPSITLVESRNIVLGCRARISLACTVSSTDLLILTSFRTVVLVSVFVSTKFLST